MDEEEEASGSDKADAAEPADGENMDECYHCKDGGDLILCDGCPKSFHFECLVPPMRKSEMPEGDWMCEFCEGGIIGGS